MATNYLPISFRVIHRVSSSAPCQMWVTLLVSATFDIIETWFLTLLFFQDQEETSSIRAGTCWTSRPSHRWRSDASSPESSWSGQYSPCVLEPLSQLSFIFSYIAIIRRRPWKFSLHLFLGTQWNKCIQSCLTSRIITNLCPSVRSRWCTTRRMASLWRISWLAFPRSTSATLRMWRWWSRI